jgi:Glycosyl hydrolase family 26
VADTQGPGRHRRAHPTPQSSPEPSTAGRARLTRILVIGAAVVTVAAVALVGTLHRTAGGGRAAGPGASGPAAAPHKPKALVGVYVPGVPQSYAGVSAFTATTGVKPGVVVYYSGWMEPFQVRFAEAATEHQAMPLVQIDPTGISLAAIASGQYDSYLRSFASTVKDFGGGVIVSFAPEMNGYWYSWGYRHTSPAVYIAAWRHVVTVFRATNADNVTWLWTVNVMHPRGNIPSPGRWWPGSSYVNWIGIDGYYYKRSWTFASLFGPTIKAVRELTLNPILISETAVAPAAGKPAKIANLFAGVHKYGLLGLVWFDAAKHKDWRVSGPAAAAAFRRSARTYMGPAL